VTRRALVLLVRTAAAGLALLGLRALLAGGPGQPSVWLTAPAAFASAKLAGDLTRLLLFRQAAVVFYEDIFWELVGFIALGLVAAGLIVVVQNLIGGPVSPYFPAFGVHLAYTLVETGRAGSDTGDERL